MPLERSMNGTATFATNRRQRAFCDAHLSPVPRFGARGNDDGRNSGIWNCGRRYIAGLLPVDEAIAQPPPKSEVATRRLLARRRLLCRGRCLELLQLVRQR